MTPTGEAIVIDPLIKDLMDNAATGEAAKLFLQSGLGGYIAKCAAEEVEAATGDLIDVDPNDPKAIAALQMKIKVASTAIMWLTDAMTAGEHAMQQLHDE